LLPIFSETPNFYRVKTMRLLFLIFTLGSAVSLFAQQAETNKKLSRKLRPKLKEGTPKLNITSGFATM
jgi:TATA-box binding protein (TBP) (component of TFIID and TFIIIB)